MTWFVIIFTRNDFCEESSEVLNPALRWGDGDQNDEEREQTSSPQSLSCLRKKYFDLSAGKICSSNPSSRNIEMVSCPEGDCNCPACLIPLVVNKELVVFRRLSEPAPGVRSQPRYHHHSVSLASSRITIVTRG